MKMNTKTDSSLTKFTRKTLENKYGLDHHCLSFNHQNNARGLGSSLAIANAAVQLSGSQ